MRAARRFRFRSFSLRFAFFGGIGGAPEAPLVLAHKIETRVFLEVGRETAEIRQFLGHQFEQEARVRVNGYFMNIR